MLMFIVLSMWIGLKPALLQVFNTTGRSTSLANQFRYHLMNIHKTRLYRSSVNSVDYRGCHLVSIHEARLRHSS